MPSNKIEILISDVNQHEIFIFHFFISSREWCSVMSCAEC